VKLILQVAENLNVLIGKLLRCLSQKVFPRGWPIPPLSNRPRPFRYETVGVFYLCGTKLSHAVATVSPASQIIMLATPCCVSSAATPKNWEPRSKRAGSRELDSRGCVGPSRSSPRLGSHPRRAKLKRGAARRLAMEEALRGANDSGHGIPPWLIPVHYD